MEEATELVWLPKSLAEQVKGIKDGAMQSTMIIDYINECKKELKTNIESMDEDVLIFRGLMATAKKAFQETKEQELKAFYELWDKFQTDKVQVGDFVKQAKAELQPLKKELQSIKDLMSSIDQWGIKDLIGLIEKLNSSFYGETEKMVKFLFDNYKKDTK